MISAPSSREPEGNAAGSSPNLFLMLLPAPPERQGPLEMRNWDAGFGCCIPDCSGQGYLNQPAEWEYR